MNTTEVLKELFDLLENYAPAWYTDDQRARMLIALTGSPDLQSDQLKAAPRIASCRRQLRPAMPSRPSTFPTRNQ